MSSTVKGPIYLLYLIQNLLEAIDDAQSSACNIVNRPALSINRLCTNALFPTNDRPSFIRPYHLMEYSEDIEECLKTCIYIIRNVVNKVENYFGTFEESYYHKELTSVVNYLNVLIIVVTSVDRMDPLEKFCGVKKSSAASTSPFTLSKLFWLRHFGSEINIPWDLFINAFIKEYGDHRDYVLSIFKSYLVNVEDRVELVRYISFVKDSCGLYEAFQKACDPGTVVLCAGVVDDSSERSVPVPIIIPSLLGYKIIQVACGGQHAAVLTSTGHVMTWGRGGFGRLGHGNIRATDVPLLVETLKDVETLQIACGFAYTAVVCRGGSLYTWGAGENGRLGLGDALDRLQPCKVEALMDHRISGVYAGSVHTCMLTDRGEVFVSGKCEYTGHGEKEDLLIPKILNAFDGVPVREISVGPGGYHTIALTIKGDVYTWGHNRVGQLGYQNSEAVPRNMEGAFFLPTPHIVSGLGRTDSDIKVSHVVAGWGHTSILTEDGNVMMCGRNFQGQLGLGDPSSFPTNERGHPFQPQFSCVATLQHKTVLQVACGGEHSVMLCSDNDLYSVGAGNRGQLGQGDLEGCTDPKLSKPLRRAGRSLMQIACGNNCTLVLAGRFQPSLLMRLAGETIRKTPALLERLQQSTNSMSELHSFVMNQEILD